MPDTVQILTPPGVAAIAVVRLRGALVKTFCKQHLTRQPRNGACVHTQLRADGQDVDDPVAVRIDAATLDLSLHGGAWVVERTRALARSMGFVEAGRHMLETIEAEVEHDLPRALTAEAMALLLAQPMAWREMIDRRDYHAMRRALGDRAFDVLLNPPVVAVVGSPNVGKSTLANRLFGRERSITANLPGTTRDWVGGHANIGGMVVSLVDTPGLRDTTDTIERQAIAQSRTVVERASLIIEVLDATAIRARQFVNADLVVINKCDQRSIETDFDPDSLRISARSGIGLDLLTQKILGHFGCDRLQSLHARCWTTRQRTELTSRLQCCVD